jgi:hypothetical protein
MVPRSLLNKHGTYHRGIEQLAEKLCAQRALLRLLSGRRCHRARLTSPLMCFGALRYEGDKAVAVGASKYRVQSGRESKIRRVRRKENGLFPNLTMGRSAHVCSVQRQRSMRATNGRKAQQSLVATQERWTALMGAEGPVHNDALGLASWQLFAVYQIKVDWNDFIVKVVYSVHRVMKTSQVSHLFIIIHIWSGTTRSVHSDPHASPAQRRSCSRTAMRSELWTQPLLQSVLCACWHFLIISALVR